MGIHTEILVGHYDDELEEMLDTIEQRQTVMALRRFKEIKVGDRVRYNDKCRPKRLIGAEGIVKEKRKTKILVLLDDPQGRFGSAPVITPMSLVEVLSA